MAEDRIVITASGIVSAMGSGKVAHAAALKAAQSGLRYARLLQTVHADTFVLGEVRQSNDELSAQLGLPAGKNGYTRTTLLALAALQQLADEAGVGLLQSGRLAVINANTVGGMCEVEHYYTLFKTPGDNGDYNKYIDTLDCAESTERMAEYFGLRPFMATISTACSSSANAILLGARMIRQGLADRAICGGCDALSRFTLNGFHSLKNVDKDPCKPFDQNRMGLNLGEGAAYLLLEKESDARARGATILAVLSGYSNTNDAYHPTAPSPDGAGAYRAMQQALDRAGLQPGDIGYINAHGTATLNNDVSEGLAIERLWQGAPPPFSSTKSFTGHTLAAAGVIESIFSILGMQEGFIPPNLHFGTPMEELTIVPTTLPLAAKPQHVLSNSFGFGGNNVSLVFSLS